MADELKATVINMKSLSQNISDPIVVGAGDANGRTLRIIFTQEAAAQMTDSTKIYLSWYHQDKEIKGYNVFTNITDEDDEDAAPTWEICYPRSMLYEGDVLACIEMVDEVSIATSTNFTIHVLIDPNDGSTYVASDDFSEFQKAVIDMTVLSDQMKAQMESEKIEFEDMQLEFMDVRKTANDAETASAEAVATSNSALSVAQSALDTIVDLTDVAREARDDAAAAVEAVAEVRTDLDALEERVNETADLADSVSSIAASVKEISEQMAEGGSCCCCEEKIEEAKQEAIAASSQHTLQALTIIEY